MIDPTVWDAIILKITAEQYHFLNRELEITKTNLKLPSLQDVSELIDDLASIAFYEFNNEHQRTERADLALNLVWLFTEAIPKEAIGNPFDPAECNLNLEHLVSIEDGQSVLDGFENVDIIQHTCQNVCSLSLCSERALKALSFLEAIFTS